MERRGFLRIVGLGGVAVVVSPQLLIPRPSIAVADPQTRIFLPPDIGWPVWRSQETVTDFLCRFEADRRRRDLELRALEVERLMEARRREMELRRLEFIRQQEAQPFNATGPAEDTWKIEVFQDLAAPINVQPGQTLRLWTGRRRRFALGSRDPEVRRGAREKMTAAFDA